MSDLGLSLRILRAEGPLALRDRLLDRVAEGLRRIRCRRLDPSSAAAALSPFTLPVLNLSPIPPSPARGGAQLQMLDRLDVERHLRPVALAYVEGRELVCEVRNGPQSGRLRRTIKASLDAEVIALTRAIGARLVHIENPAGLPLELVPRLATAGLKTVVSLHDFTLFCIRPHLIEAPVGEFCGYCRDDARCRACLLAHGCRGTIDQSSYRRRGAAVLGAADLVVHPSEFLRRRYEQLSPDGVDDDRQAVIPPATGGSTLATTTALPHAHVAFVGGASRHKGGHLLRAVVAAVRTRIPSCRFTSLGNGDAEILEDLRRDRGIRIRGYYRRGELPVLLRRLGARVAVFASIWPETYGLVVDECLRAGVSVVAFDHGAVADRARARRDLRVTPVERGAIGLAATTLELLSEPPTEPRHVDQASLPTPAGAAERTIESYRRVLAEQL